MQLTEIDGVKLEVGDRGSGEPVVFVHGAMGDECAAMLTEPSLASQYRLIDYHRRGWGKSDRPATPVSIPQQAEDCRALINHLGVERAHFVGQSYGGVILLQLALDFPDAVHSVALLEPAVPSVLFNSPAFGAIAAKAGAFYGSGDKASAIEVFAREVGGDDYRALFDRTLPSGYFERWVADADTIFQFDMPALQPWEFTQADAAQITQPVLNLTGANTTAYFRKSHEMVRAWLPHSESHELPNATHCMLQTNPKGVAECLTNFLSRHRLHG